MSKEKKSVGVYYHIVSDRWNPQHINTMIGHLINDFPQEKNEFVFFLSHEDIFYDYISEAMVHLGHYVDMMHPNTLYNLSNSVVAHYFFTDVQMASDPDFNSKIEEILTTWEKYMRLSINDTRRTRSIKVLFI